MNWIKWSAYLMVWVFWNPAVVFGQIVLPNSLTDDLELVAGASYLIKDSLWVPADYTLSIPAGVQIEMEEAAILLVDGGLELNGNAANPIRFKAQSNSWKGIHIRSANGLIRLQHCIIQDATTPSPDLIAAISAYDTNIYLHSVRFSKNRQCVYVENSSEVKIIQCRFDADNLREQVNIRQNSNCLIDSCQFYQVNAGDAIDFDQVTNGVISNCWLEAGADDGIDIGEESKAILIRGNRIFDFAENGITVGEESETQVEQNLIVNCIKAVEAKDGGIIDLVNNTIAQNDYAFAGFDFMANNGGGKISVVNTIVADNRMGLSQGEDLDLSVRYSLSNTHFLPGSTNLFAEPQFQNPADRNYELRSISPCINQGDPSSPLDPDNSRNDIGAFPADNRELLIRLQNFPNPFQQQTIFSYELEVEQQVELYIYDLQGRLLETLINTKQAAGKYYYHWLAGTLESGVYVYALYLDGKRTYAGKAIKQ